MKRSTLILLAVIAGIILLVIYSLQGGQSTEDYIAFIEKERKEKDDFMKSDEASPFRVDSVAYSGLNYFPIDPQLNIKARLEPISKKKVVMLATSDGLQQKYLEYAYATFTLAGVENRLLILEVMDMGPQRGKLFLAFADDTSGKESYGAGRYLDIKKVAAASSIQLDFNLAYNPYCAYSDSFTCPFPPRENLLAVAIRAGEKSYHE